MKHIPSYQCYVNPDERTYDDRRLDRKAFSQNQRRRDECFFVDLPGTYDYDHYFMNNIDPKTKLNIKGPFANLHWSFKVVNERQSNEETESPTTRRVRLQSDLLNTRNLFVSSFLFYRF